MADAMNGGSVNPSTGDLSELLKTTPFAPLLDIPNVDEKVIIEGFGKAFGNGGLDNPFPVGSVDPSDLPYNGDPFAGDNFWNIFAGGQDPTKVGGSGDPLTGGENPVAGGENPFAGGENPFAGGENPFAGGENPFAGGSSNPVAGGENPFTGGSNPFAGGENPFAGGSNPFASGENPFA